MGSIGNGATAQVEREAKLHAPAGFRLPELSGLIPGATATASPVLHLDAVYYDTSDLRLARAGITVRYRSGEDAPPWTVKFPEAAGRGSAITRREISLPGAPDAPPAAVADLVLAYTRGRRLVPVARLETRRQPVALRDGEDGRLLAEVVDDEVAVTRGHRPARGFRELEVETHVGGRLGRDLLEAGVARLVEAGAAAEPPVPKLVRALGSRAERPADVETVELPAQPTPADLVRQAVARSVAQLLRHDPGTRLGTDPEDVHQLRVAARRLRSDLRTFSRLLDGGRTAAVRAELAWLGRQVGAVRDADVLGARLAATYRTLPEADQAGAALLLRRLGTERETARAAMLRSLREPRYLRLLDALVKLAAEPPLRVPEPPGESKVPDRAAPAPSAPGGELAARIARRPWQRLELAVAMLDPNPPDTRLHEIRILAKRCRYAAEAVAPLAGRPARRFAARIAGLQTVLGDHQDTVVAEDWLRAAAAADPAARVAAGQLIALERARRAELRVQWPAVWRKASADKLHRWM